MDSLAGYAAAVLVGVQGGGAGPVAHAPSGAFVGAETGYAAMFARGEARAESAWTFGGRAGYQFGSGLALEARFDDLGVSLPGTNAEILGATFGARYSLPFVVMPFAEVLIGPAFAEDRASFDAGLGAGLSVPILRHLTVDASARDWITDFDATVRHTATFEVGFTLGFGGGH